jgi:hypothetical protein
MELTDFKLSLACEMEDIPAQLQNIVSMQRNNLVHADNDIICGILEKRKDRKWAVSPKCPKNARDFINITSEFPKAFRTLHPANSRPETDMYALRDFYHIKVLHDDGDAPPCKA